MLWLGHLRHLVWRRWLLMLLLLLLMLLLLMLLVLLLLLVLLMLLWLRVLLNSRWHRLSSLFLLHELLVNLGMLWHGVGMLVLWRWWSVLGLGCHLLGGLWVVEGRVGHVSVVVVWRRRLRGIRLWRSEIRTGTANVRS